MKIINKYLALVIGLIIISLFIYNFSNIVAYIVAGWVISLLGIPLVDKLQSIKIKKWKMGPSLAAGLTLLVFVMALALFFALIFPPIVTQAKNLSAIDTEDIMATVESPIAALEITLHNYGLLDRSTTIDEEITRYIKSVFNPNLFLDFFRSFLGTITNIFIGLFSILFISFFFLKDSNLFDHLITSLVLESHEVKSKNSIHQSSLMLRKYFSGLLIQLTLFFLVIWIALLLFGFKNALLIAFIAALLNIIPYLGPLMGAIFGIFITISSNVGLDFYSIIVPQIGLLALIFLIVQQIDGFVIQPYVFSKSIKAHPLEIFLIVLIGGQLAGIPGMILAIPVYTVIRVVAQIFFSEFKVVRRLTDGLKTDSSPPIA